MIILIYRSIYSCIESYRILFWGIGKYRIIGYENRYRIESWRTIRFTPLMFTSHPRTHWYVNYPYTFASMYNFFFVNLHNLTGHTIMDSSYLFWQMNKTSKAFLAVQTAWQVGPQSNKLIMKLTVPSICPLIKHVWSDLQSQTHASFNLSWLQAVADDNHCDVSMNRKRRTDNLLCLKVPSLIESEARHS